MKRHVALTGFMAAGKSTIGQRLARKLNLPFYDVDDWIVEAHGPIEQIFATQGDEAFRRYERDALERVLHEPAGIVAVGGGAVTYDATLTLLEQHAYRVFLNLPPEHVIGRWRRSKRVRPLLGTSPSLSQVKELYAKRLPRYAGADLAIHAAHLTTTQILERIVEWMNEKKILP